MTGFIIAAVIFSVLAFISALLGLVGQRKEGNPRIRPVLWWKLFGIFAFLYAVIISLYNFLR